VEVKRPKNHGGEFNGNQCCYLLAKIDWIENLIEQENLNSHITDIYKAFVSYKKLKAACFGQTLDPNPNT
jgi:hypothetical protein